MSEAYYVKFGMVTFVDFERIPNYYLLYLFIFDFINGIINR
jgi:hypothetical protein